MNNINEDTSNKSDTNATSAQQASSTSRKDTSKCSPAFDPMSLFNTKAKSRPLGNARWPSPSRGKPSRPKPKQAHLHPIFKHVRQPNLLGKLLAAALPDGCEETRLPTTPQEAMNALVVCCELDLPEIEEAATSLLCEAVGIPEDENYGYDQDVIADLQNAIREKATQLESDRDEALKDVATLLSERLATEDIEGEVSDIDVAQACERGPVIVSYRGQKLPLKTSRYGVNLGRIFIRWELVCAAIEDNRA